MENLESNNAEMTSRNLDRLFDLFLACRELQGEARSALLAEACAGNPSLQRDVERLIREDASAEGFLSQPMRLLTTAFSFGIKEGQRIGRYVVTGFVGRGGMGEVWRAHDHELDRAVALKFVQSGSAVNQLTREARMASALNHPGIVIVYDVIVWEGTPVLVMELVTGTPLSAFCNGLMPLDELVSVGAQTSSALAVAHREGIIHGDLKPDNILWSADRFAKILDFGLARKAASKPDCALAGTPVYMSPEQARGEVIGTASDVYSLGLVLFELATGHRAFGRQAVGDIGARRTNPPRVSGLRTRFPEELDRLIYRMLEPDPVRRIGMSDAADSLRRAERAPVPGKVRRAVALFAGIVLALAVAASLLIYRGRPSSSLDSPRHQLDFSRMTVRPLASQPGLEDNPSISPDGFWVSCLYRARASDPPALQVHATKGGPPVVIRTDGLVVHGSAAWSPDSGELAFSAGEGSGKQSIYRVHRTGGTPRRIFGCRQENHRGCAIDWSPDGRVLAVTDDPGELYLLDLVNGRRRDLISGDKLYITTPRFSPNGRWIAYARETSMTSDDLYVIAAAGGQPRRITQNPWSLISFGWSTDGKSLLACSSRESNAPQVWQFPLDGSKQYRLGPLDAAVGSYLSVSRGRGTLAWVRNLSANNLWRMPSDQSGGPPELLVNSAAMDIDAEWSRNGRIVFRSDRSGVNELWIANADGSGAWQATQFRGPFTGDPHWAPDGRSIAFTSRVTGNPDIFVMRCELGATACSDPWRLTRSPAPDANPTWSADGRWIYFTSSRSGKFEIWRMHPDGSGEAERITWNGGYYARESADGKWLYFSKLIEHAGFWRITLPVHGSDQMETELAIDVPEQAVATWALGTHELFYYPSTKNPAVPFLSVRAVDLQTGSTRDLPLKNVRLGRGLSLSPDERWLLRSQVDRGLTLVMLAE